MNLTINGEKKSISQTQEKLTIISLIKILGHDPRLIVVEFNGLIVPPNDWAQTEVKDGHTLEIVTIVGGGS